MLVFTTFLNTFLLHRCYVFCYSFATFVLYLFYICAEKPKGVHLYIYIYTPVYTRLKYFASFVWVVCHIVNLFCISFVHLLSQLWIYFCTLFAIIAWKVLLSPSGILGRPLVVKAQALKRWRRSWCLPYGRHPRRDHELFTPRRDTTWE